MDILKATRLFEDWLRQRIPVVESDLVYKHAQMRADPFLFFRATYYRWAQIWPKRCPRLARTPLVGAVADLHLENFGTWRDEEGRLVWGVNDFDEAHPLPFANDLVRLATSALLSLQIEPSLKLDRAEIPRQIAAGYQAALAAGGEPFVLMERHPHLRNMATQQLRQPAEFWPRLQEKTLRPASDLPDGWRRALRKSMPAATKPIYRVDKVPKGLGSLGRRRYLALATWQGGLIAREAKDVVPSGALWAAGERAGRGNPWLEKTITAAVRCADPFYAVKDRLLVRRLSPDCSRIDLDQLRHHEDLASLLHCMGWETANIHLGTRKAARTLPRALHRLSRTWLRDAAEIMFDQTLADWKAFQKSRKE